MKLGFTGEAFGNLILVMALFALIIIAIIFVVAHKRGVDVTARSFQLRVGISCLIIFGVIPFWLSDLTTNQKIMGTISALLVAIGNYFAIDKMQQALRGHFKDMKKAVKMDKKQQ